MEGITGFIDNRNKTNKLAHTTRVSIIITFLSFPLELTLEIHRSNRLIAAKERETA